MAQRFSILLREKNERDDPMGASEFLGHLGHLGQTGHPKDFAPLHGTPWRAARPRKAPNALTAIIAILRNPFDNPPPIVYSISVTSGDLVIMRNRPFSRLPLTAILALIVGPCALSGCAALEGVTAANPRTKIGIGPFSSVASFYDNKDNDFKLKGLKVDPVTGFVEIEELVISNNASRVREANVGQLEQFLLMQSRAWDSVDRLTNIANSLFAQLNTGITGRSAPTPDIPVVPVNPVIPVNPANPANPSNP